MTTGATGQLGLALPVQGELSGTWGDTVNNGITEYTNIAIAGTLTLTDTGQALEFEATLSAGTTWARDFLEAHKAGLIRGLSPGFRVPPGGERIERSGTGTLRSITRAELFEISAVTRPAYPTAQIEARSWQTKVDDHPGFHPLNRWRL